MDKNKYPICRIKIKFITIRALWYRVWVMCRVFEKFKVSNKVYVIREPCSMKDYRELMNVQLRIWGMPGYIEAVTYHMLIAGHRNGGIVIGVFEKDTGKAVGIVFGVPGYRDGEIYVYSHLFGFVPELRGLGLGTKLKKYQRLLALEKGYVLFRWTYDPLQSGNAYFNIVKHGVVVKKFMPNYYGYMEDEINRGMPSDRFEAEWWIKSRRVEMILDKKVCSPGIKELLELGAEYVTETRIEDGIPILEKVSLDKKSDLLLIEIPYSLEQVRKKNPSLLVEWKIKLREVFNHYLNKMGYKVIWLVVEKKNEVKRTYYVLWRRSLEYILDGAYPWSSEK